jgi:hypothetical protein
MVHIVVDVESDGPIPCKYSMVAFGAVVVKKGLKKTFKAFLRPVSENYIPAALAVSNFTREQTLLFDDPYEVMVRFNNWLKEVVPKGDKMVFVSDNNGFDWQWINYYFHTYLGKNPFGFSSRRIGDIYSGMKKNMNEQNNWRKFVITPHTHDPLSDAIGHAEAILKMKKLGLTKVNPRVKKNKDKNNKQ